MRRIRKLVQDYIYGNKLTVVVRILIGSLFIYSSIFKIIDPAAFAGSVAQYGILTENLVPYAAIAIPYMEIFIGICLVLGFSIRPASTAGIMLMIIFMAGIIYNMAYGKTFDCGCFELSYLGISETIGWGLLIRDAVLTALFWSLYHVDRHPFSLESVVLESDLREM